nr:alanine--tRNA ligase [candidate division Zixibacteria bacterium]
MTEIKTSEIRQSFIDYFKSRDHKLYRSSPVIPFDDRTLMFANAGMNQFKDIFTGRKTPEYPRAVSVQKCMRAGGKHNDLENVGRTGRHHTFFEMLGNFSFGDYFKEEAIFYGWEWVTKYLRLPADRLYATVYNDDDEAFQLWGKIAPELKNGRILRFDKKENYWSMGDVGPNGPCSEIHFDRGEKFGTGPEVTVNGEGDRFVEIWNLVFMQYNTGPDGVTEPLPKPSVDTGAGLERIACIMQNADSNYETDIFLTLIESISEITGRKYHSDNRGVSHRVIADHIRALTFCIADGGGLSSEKQGYVLRRILRRAARHGRKLGMNEPFIYKIVPTLTKTMGDVYPEISEKRTHIENVIRSEEESFGRTLDTGLELFDALAERLKRSGQTVVSGEEVFRLYDTYGFPVDLTNVMAEEKNLTLDMAGYEKKMQKQQEQSRTSSQFAGGQKEQFQLMLTEMLGQLPQEQLKTEFVREKFEITSPVAEVFELTDGQDRLLAVIPQKTPFYVEAGGQTGDQGYISCDLFKIKAEHLFKINEAIVHLGHIVEKNYEDLKDVGEFDVKLSLFKERRMDIMRNHTATHLLHAALRKVLGEHVRQSGSYVGPDKLRFDFSHFQPLTSAELKAVEMIVNGKILSGTPVATVEDDLEKARHSGAMAIFGEKYGDRVRVVSVDDFSKELCGGTHVDNVSQIGTFIITLETAVASGIRRIEAVTGHEAMLYISRLKDAVDQISHITNQPLESLAEAVTETYEKLLQLQKENKKLKSEKFTGGALSVGKEIKVDGVSVRFHDFGEVASEEMAGWIDGGKSENYPLICIAIGNINGKRTFMSSASGQASIHVGKLSQGILAELGGRGGGKPTFAQGSLPDTIDPDEVLKTVESKLKEFMDKGH